MKINNVPQDEISTYAENKKAIYATDENGSYKVIASSGWDVEGEATKQALQALQDQAEDAYQSVLNGDKSPLYYHMYAQRMDLTVLSQSTGIFQWRIKRHFNPSVFIKLSESLLSRYSEALGISLDEINNLPPLKEK